MNITHPEMVTRLMKPKDELQFTADQCAMIHATLGIAGEAGEIVDAVKKHTIYGKPIDRENLVEELGDMEFYMEDLRQRIGITRDECLAANMTKLAKRYPGFDYTDAKAQQRADKSDGWIEWKGGECPVAGKVDYIIRCGREFLNCVASDLMWQHAHCHADIIAYRLAK